MRRHTGGPEEGRGEAGLDGEVGEQVDLEVSPPPPYLLHTGKAT